MTSEMSKRGDFLALVFIFTLPSLLQLSELHVDNSSMSQQKRSWQKYDKHSLQESTSNGIHSEISYILVNSRPRLYL